MFDRLGRWRLVPALVAVLLVVALRPWDIEETDQPFGQFVIGGLTITSARSDPIPTVLSNEQAIAAATAAAKERFRSDFDRLDLRRGGLPLSFNDFHVTDGAFAEQVTEAHNQLRTFGYTSATPQNVWIVIFRADGVQARGASGSEEVIDLNVVISDEQPPRTLQLSTVRTTRALKANP